MYNDAFKKELLSKLNNIEDNQDIVGSVIDGINMKNVNKLIAKHDTVQLGYGTPLLAGAIVFIAMLSVHAWVTDRFFGGEVSGSRFMFFVVVGFILGCITYGAVQKVMVKVFRNQIQDDDLHAKYAPIRAPEPMSELERRKNEIFRRYEEMGGDEA